MRRSALVLSVAAALAVPGLALAVEGNLDPSFSGDGKVLTSISEGVSANGVAIDSQGRIVAAGVSYGGDVVVTRYLPDGRLDPSFSGDGKILFSFAGGSNARAVAIDSRNRVIVAGKNTAIGQSRTSDFGVARLTPRGQLDPSFSGDGRVVTHVGGDISKDEANSVAIDPAGRIVAAGASRVGGQTGFALVRYRPNGALDPSFSGDGKARTVFGAHSTDVANSVAIDSAGRIVAAGTSRDFSAPDGDKYRSGVVRYLPGGNLDSAFSGDGRQLVAYHDEQLDLEAVATDDRNRVVLAGTDGFIGQNNYFAAMRLRPNGALDPSFATDGKEATAFPGGFANSVAIDPNGRIVVAGWNDAPAHSGGGDIDVFFAIARYTPRGALDPSFSGDGQARTSFGDGWAQANSVTTDSLGRIVAAGWAEGPNGQRFALARYLSH